MEHPQPLTDEELAAGLPEIRRSPRGEGTVELIVARPAKGERTILEEGLFDIENGLVGDTWIERPSRSMPDGLPHPDKQVTVMNARAVALMAQHRHRWALAGDQLYVDLDLSSENLPPGTTLSVGGIVLEVTAPPHTGCALFAERFGRPAFRFVNSEEGRALNLRGINAKVIRPGMVRRGDAICKA